MSHHTTSPETALTGTVVDGRITRRTALTGAAAVGTLATTTALTTADASATTVGLYDKMHAIDASTTGMLAVAVHDHRNGHLWQYNAPARNECASIVKVLILATVCYRAQAARRALSTWEKQQATQMIRVSDNTAATNLFASVGRAPGLQAMANRLGMTQTRVNSAWGLTTTSAYDQLILLNEIGWRGTFLTAANRSYILGLMGSVTASQRWGVGSVGTSVVKDGWLSYNGLWRINSIGRVTGPGRDYSLAILQRGTPTMGIGTSVANRVAQTIYTQLATPL